MAGGPFFCCSIHPRYATVHLRQADLGTEEKRRRRPAPVKHASDLLQLLVYLKLTLLVCCWRFMTFQLLQFCVLIFSQLQQTADKMELTLAATRLQYTRELRPEPVETLNLACPTLLLLVTRRRKKPKSRQRSDVLFVVTSPICQFTVVLMLFAHS